MPELERIQPFGPGTQEYDIRDNTKLPLSGGTITGDLEVEGNLELGSPLPISSGGTGSMTPSEALAALGAAAETHTHSASDISSGTLDSARLPTVPVSKGGTGATTAAAALTALGAAAETHTHSASDISSGTLDSARLPTVPVSKGGTGATTVASARNALGLGNTSGAVPIANGGTGATTASLAVKNLLALGLGVAETSIPSHADYNSYAEPGVYSVANNSIAATLANRPSSIAGKLVVWQAMARSGSPSETWYYVLQAYTNYQGTTWLRRGGTESTTSVIWNSWFRIYDTNDPPTADEVGAAAATHTHSQYFDNATLRTKNTILAAPSSANGAASFRALVAADLPTVTIAKGGTGKTTAAEGLAALGGISKKLLWTNSAPTSSMSGKTIAISNVSGYSEFEVYFMMSTSTQYAEARFFLYNVQGRVQMAGTSNGYVRDVKFTSSGMEITTGTSSSYVIPYKIYGIKGLT